MEAPLDQLLSEAKRGSRRAFDSLVSLSEPELRAFCTRLVGPADADDALQETFVAAWRALGSFRGDSSARTWLFAIARRAASRTRRSKERWSELARMAPSPPAAGDLGLGVELEEALSNLELERRTALLLTQVLGFSYAEAAQICDCPVGTIRSRVARAREQLLGVGRLTSRRAG